MKETAKNLKGIFEKTAGKNLNFKETGKILERSGKSNNKQLGENRKEYWKDI